MHSIFILCIRFLIDTFNNCPVKGNSGVIRTFKYITEYLFFFSSLLDVVHILLSGEDTTALYSWNSEGNQFCLVLEAPYADYITSTTARSLNSSKSLIALSVESSSQIYELTTISKHSDFIPRQVFWSVSQLLHSFFCDHLFLTVETMMDTCVCCVYLTLKRIFHWQPQDNLKSNFSQFALKYGIKGLAVKLDIGAFIQDKLNNITLIRNISYYIFYCN